MQGDQANRDKESLLAMLHDRVMSKDILRVVAKATGSPVQNLLKGERDKLVHVCCFLFLVPFIDWGFNTGFGVYGRISGSKSCRERPHSVSNKQHCLDLLCGTTSTQLTHRIALVFGSDGCGSGVSLFASHSSPSICMITLNKGRSGS